MSSIRTARGRRAAAALVLLVLSVSACVQGTEVADPDPAPTATDATDGGADDDAGGGEDTAGDQAPTDDGAGAAVTGVEYADCHEFATAGGASDGVLDLTFGETDVDLPVAVDVAFEDGTSVTYEATVGVDGHAVVLLPLSSFGEVVTVTEVRVDGTVRDVEGGYPLSWTVAPESDCSAHPENG